MNLKKRGQIFSIDLIFAVIIFLIAVALFYANFSFIPEQRVERRLQIDPDFLFQNIEENTKVYDQNHGKETSFFFDFKIDDNKLIEFTEMNYKDFKDILFQNILVTGLDVDACLYFTNRSGFIVPIDNGIENITGIGNSTNEYIIVESNNISCGTKSQSLIANPGCYGNYEYTRLFFKPVLKKKQEINEIVLMNVLVCARQKGSTLFLEKPEEEPEIPPEEVPPEELPPEELPPEEVPPEEIPPEELPPEELPPEEPPEEVPPEELPPAELPPEEIPPEEIPPEIPPEEVPPEEIITCFKTNYGIEICGNTIDEDCDGIKRVCPPDCKPVNSGIEICGNEIDEDCDGDDIKCAVPGCKPKNSGIEICGNEIDEDCDGKDIGCVPGCTPVNNGIEICGNDIDESCNGYDDACINIAHCTTKECRLSSGAVHKEKSLVFGFVILIVLLLILAFFIFFIKNMLRKEK